MEDLCQWKCSFHMEFQDRLQSLLYLAPPQKTIQGEDRDTNTSGSLEDSFGKNQKQNHLNKLFQKGSLSQKLCHVSAWQGTPLPAGLPLFMAPASTTCERNPLDFKGNVSQSLMNFFLSYISLPHATKDLRKLIRLRTLK